MKIDYKPPRIGHCLEHDADVIQDGDPLASHIDRCNYWELGKPKHD